MNEAITSNNINNNNLIIKGVIKKIELHTYDKKDIWYPLIFKEYYKIANFTERKKLNTINRLFQSKKANKITEYDFNIEETDDLFVFLDINDKSKDIFKIGNKITIEIYEKDFCYTVKSVNLNQ